MLIECGDHQWAPMVIVCIHLISGDSHEFCRIPSGDLQTEWDYLCPTCLEGCGGDLEECDIDDLRPVCIHCSRYMLKKGVVL